ncbi:MAG: stage III sporulation protein AD [Lachnospiraceae bacterium]|nr:stage III sporulation protein AD [Lachnospiraceae bacterium]
MDVVKIGIMGVAGVLLATFLKKEKSEYSMLISMGICILIFSFLIHKMQMVLVFVERLESMLSLDSSYIDLILKMIGIAYVAGFAMDVCKDAGYGAIGSQIETFAKISILVVSLPVLLTFLEVIGSIL